MTLSPHNKILIRLSIMMFLQFFVWGSWYVTIGTYLGNVGFSLGVISQTYFTNSIAAIVAPFFIGMIADRYFPSQKVMGILHIIGAVFMYWSSEITTAGLLIFSLLIYNLCYMPTLGLVNAISFNQIDKPDQDFPKIRVWGTLGWIAAGLTITALDYLWLPNIETTNIPLKIAAFCSVLLGLYSFTLPDTPPKMKGQNVSLGEILGLKALRLFKNRSFSLFVLASFLISIPLAFYYALTNNFLNDVGMEGTAGKMAFGQISEVLFLLLIPFFFSRLGVKKMLIVGMAAWALRYALFAMGDIDSLVWMFYGGIILHGICYDFFFVTGQIYVDNKAPRDVRASAQGLITLITYGAGMAIGNIVAGFVGDYYTLDTGKDWESIWWIPSIFAVVVLVMFIIGFKDDTPKVKSGAEA